MKVPFRTDLMDGMVCVMNVEDLDIVEIRFDTVTREIRVVYQEPDYAAMSWQDLRESVLAMGGIYTNKKAALEFLTGV